MAVVQTEVISRQGTSGAGSMADMGGPIDVVSLVLGGGVDCEFGMGVVFGDDDACSVPADDTGVFAGVAQESRTKGIGDADSNKYVDNDVVPTCRVGRIKVIASGAVTSGQPAYLVPVTGSFSADAVDNISTNGFFRSSGADGDVVVLQLGS